MRSVSEYLELTILVLLLAGSVVIMVLFMQRQDQPILQPIEDKTAFTHDTMLYAPEEQFTGSDLMMAISVIDEFTPFPRRITWTNSQSSDNKIDKHLWVLDAGFVADKWNRINTMYLASGGNLVAQLNKECAYVVYMYPGITSFKDAATGKSIPVTYNPLYGTEPYIYYMFK